MTSRVGAVWAVALATALMVLFPATAQAATSDVMTSVDVAITLDEQGGATFKETIAYDFGPGEHHGIFRTVVTRQAVAALQAGAQGQDFQSSDRYRYYDLSDVTASSPTGAPSGVDLVDQGLATQIRIGDPDTLVDGPQTYVVSYHLANVMNPFPDHVEFFYNVFKQDAIPKDRLNISVTGPGGVTQVRCARGGSGTDTTGDGSPCDAATPGNPARFLLTALRSNEDVTIATQLPSAGFGTLTPDVRTGTSAFSQRQSQVLSSLALGGGVLVPLLAAGGMGVLVATRGRDERYAGLTPGLTPGPTAAPGSAPVVRGGPSVVAVQFTPPAGVQPGMVGTLIDESADTVDVSATVVDLAVRGYLRIEETQTGALFKRTDWTLTRLVPDPSQPPLRAWESTILEGVFEDSNPVQLSALKTHFASTLATAKGQMYADVVQRGWFRRNPSSQRAAWQGLGFLLMGGGVAATVFLGGATGDIDRTGGIGIGIPSGVVLGIGLIVAGLIVRVLGKRMAARTAEGTAVNAQSLGFKKYLETAEAGQIRFEEAQSIFSRYLPYAIVFGVADRWAGTFQKVAEAAEAAGQPLVMPTWYLYAGTGFPDFGSIADGAGSFATTADGTFAASATTGGSGGSGFGGGGGFSGGGGGGSSSGSW